MIKDMKQQDLALKTLKPRFPMLLTSQKRAPSWYSLGASYHSLITIDKEPNALEFHKYLLTYLFFVYAVDIQTDVHINVFFCTFFMSKSLFSIKT